MLPGSLELWGELLLGLLLIWVLRRLRTTGSGPGLASLSNLVSRLSKDFGTLVEIIDDLFPVSTPSNRDEEEDPSTNSDPEEGDRA